jgi:transposase
MLQDTLIDVDPVVPESMVGVPAGVAGTKVFRAYDQAQTFLMPPSLADWVPEDHLARVIDVLVAETLDLTPFLASYENVKGFPPYDPAMMLKVLVYCYCTGVTSSRKIERACHTDVAVRFLAANQTPDHRSFGRFRRRHLAAFNDLFVQVLTVAKKAGMVSLGRVALDGSKVRANASRRKAMSYERMGPKLTKLEEEIAELRAEAARIIAEAEATDATEDDRHGDRRGDELPDELARRETRAATIRKAMKDLEDEAAEAAAEHEQGKQARKARRKAERAATKAGHDPDSEAVAEAGASEAATVHDPDVAEAVANARACPKPKAQRNFTDPESRIMKMSDGSFHQCFNAQAIVDEHSQIIVASQLTNQAADAPHLPGMIALLWANIAAWPHLLLADAGYFSADNIDRARDAGLDVLLATGRFKHDEPPAPAPRGPIPKDASPKQRMARRLAVKQGRADYRRRKAIVEPVFGQMQTRQNAGQVRLRGLDAAQAEHTLHAACHNILKLFTAGIDLGPAPA